MTVIMDFSPKSVLVFCYRIARNHVKRPPESTQNTFPCPTLATYYVTPLDLRMKPGHAFFDTILTFEILS